MVSKQDMAQKWGKPVKEADFACKVAQSVSNKKDFSNYFKYLKSSILD